MTIDNEEGATNHTLIGYRTKDAGVKGILLPHTLNPIIIVIGTVLQTGQQDDMLPIADGITGQGLHLSKEHTGIGTVRRVFKSHDITAFHGLPTEPSETKQTATAGTESVTPSVHHHMVARLERRLQSISSHRIDGKSQRPDDHHQQQRDGQGNQESESWAHGKYESIGR